jgi:hypothetical protein
MNSILGLLGTATFFGITGQRLLGWNWWGQGVINVGDAVRFLSDEGRQEEEVAHKCNSLRRGSLLL